MRTLYTLLFVLLLPAVLCRLWLRGIKLPDYRKRWGERFAAFDTPHFEQPVIWVHTVSVGEFIAAKPMIDRLLEKKSHQLVVTTMTPTGSERVKASYGDRVFHVYAPYDIPSLVNRFLAKTQPSLAIFLETELWPNILHCCQQKNIPSLLANARLSEKSARGYKKVKPLASAMLGNLSLAAIQNRADAQRFIDLGLNESKAQITGSIKFDIAIDNMLAQKAQQLKKAISADTKFHTWIAASTHKSEDEIILDAFQQLRARLANTRLILVPRHPDRFNDVYQLCQSRAFSTIRRSENSDQQVAGEFDILLGDTMGELMLFYGCADAAFVGGSFVENGGHNMIEPAVWGIPVLSGPSQFNFAEIARLLNEAGGLITVESASQLAEKLASLLPENHNPGPGAAAKRVAEQNQGALDHLLKLIAQTLEASPGRPH